MKARPAAFVQVHAADRAEWRAWLEKNHASSSGIALVFYKKASGKPCITYDEAVEEALCLGWIDSRKNSLDAERYTFMFSPRKAGSAWSKSNKARVEKLIASGRMTAIGLAKVEAAKRDGSWSGLDALENLTRPAGARQGTRSQQEGADAFRCAQLLRTQTFDPLDRERETAGDTRAADQGDRRGSCARRCSGVFQEGLTVVSEASQISTGMGGIERRRYHPCSRGSA